MEKSISLRLFSLIKASAATFAALAAVTGCSKDARTQQVYTFEAVQADSDSFTRTVIQNETAVYWSPNDSINVFYGSKTSGKFTGANKAASASTSFNGSFGTFDGGINVGTEDPGFWGLYPYSSTASCDGSGVTVSVPTAQTAVDGTFAPDLFPSIARSSSLALAFYNVCGGVVFTVSRSDIVSVTFKGNNGESIAGTACVGVDSDGKPQVSSFISAANEITVTAPDSGFFKVGVKYYIVAYPAELSNGFNLSYHTTDEVGTYTSSSPVVIHRSTFGRLTDLDKESVFEPVV